MITPLKTLFCTPKPYSAHHQQIAPPPLPSRPSTAAAAWASRRPSPPGLLPWRRPGSDVAPPLPLSPAAVALERRRPSPPGLLPRQRPAVSRPICDTIQKELKGPTKDRPAYWNTFARWISLHQHYIIDGDTYKRHTMPHEYNITIHKSIIRLRMEHKQKLKRHPPC